MLVLRTEQRKIKGKVHGTSWQARYTFSDLIGKSPRFQQALAVARAVAATDLPVLLLGESGTGKELLAHAIHTASPRASGSFVPFNCGGVTEELIAAELFGYVEGAFTGAVRGGRPGKRLFGTARKGNVWLRRSLCQAPWAASHTKEAYLAVRLRRLAARKGKKRALVAVAHTVLVSLYHMLKTKQAYRDRGADYLDRIDADSLKRTLVKRLERLGLHITVENRQNAAPLPP